MFKCEICGKEVEHLKRICDGDGQVHHHGAVHTMLVNGSTRNHLALVGVECGCAILDKTLWNTGRSEELKKEIGS
jgi:hypothetical protein